MSVERPLKERFNSCWVGDRLLPLANACINSFTARGFPFRLYTYGFVQDVPDLVDRCDATAIIPAHDVFVAHGGLETFADVFAYRFLTQLGGWWVDNDVVCNADHIPDAEIAFAEERPGLINNAVLRFPRNHPFVLDLLEYIAAIDPVASVWGSTGPLALSKIVRKHDLASYQLKTSDCYPLHWKEAPKFLFPEFAAEIAERTAQSPFVHLWGATLREIQFDFQRWRPLKGSYLDTLYKKHLDDRIAEELRPFDEGVFRQSVQHYVARTWNETLSLL